MQCIDCAEAGFIKSAKRTRVRGRGRDRSRLWLGARSQSNSRLFWFIFAELKGVAAFDGLQDVDAFAAEARQSVDGPPARLMEHGLEQRECLFDRIEVRVVGREEAELCTGRLGFSTARYSAAWPQPGRAGLWPPAGRLDRNIAEMGSSAESVRVETALNRW